MSREELADAVNSYLFRETQRVFDMDGNHIGKYELGEYRWPRTHYRDALRAVLKVNTNAELGFYPRRTIKPRSSDMTQPSTAPTAVPVDRAVTAVVTDVPAVPVSGPAVSGPAVSAAEPPRVGRRRRAGGSRDLAPSPGRHQGASNVPASPSSAGVAVGRQSWVTPAAAESFRHDMVRAVLGDEQVNLDEWERIASEYGSDYITTSPATIFEDLSIDLRIAQEHLMRLRRSSDQRTLRRVIARLTGLVAETLSDLGDLRASIRWWRTANQAADASEDPAVRTWVRGREIIHGVYDRRPVRTLLDMADRAEAITICPFAGVAIVHAGRAKALSIRGDSTEAMRALNAVRVMSDRVLSRATQDDILSVYTWSEVHLRHVETFVHTYLGHFVEAEAAAQAAIALYPDRRSSGCSQVQLHQGMCMVRQGNITGGLRDACRVLVDLPEAQRRDMVLEVARHILQAVPPPDRLRPEARNLRRLLGL